jgi:hypothetical protein
VANYVVCLKHGNKYSAEYVNVLHNMVTRNLTIPFNFACFTENGAGIKSGIEIRPLPAIPDVKGWWYKPMFFNPGLGIKGTILYIDLDVIIFKNMDKLFTYNPGQFCVIRDFNRVVHSNWNRMNSSVVRFETGQHSQVYEKFMENPKSHSARYHGDQDWLFANVKSDFCFWPDEWIQSYKWEMRGKPEMSRVTGKRNFATPGTPKILSETCMAVFHGDPNPKDSIDPWCADNWY